MQQTLFVLLLQLQHLSCALFPQPEHIAAARAEHPLHGGMVALQQRFRHIGLNGARKAAALHPPCIRHAPLLPCRMLWLNASATDSP